MRISSQSMRHGFAALLTAFIVLAFNLRQSLIVLLVIVALVIALFPIVWPKARSTWRFGLWATAGVLGLAFVVTNAARSAPPPQPGPPIVVQTMTGLQGRLIWAANNTLEGLTLSSGQQSTVAQVANTSLVADVALSPKGDVYALADAPGAGGTTANDLYLMTANGGTPRLLLSHNAAGGGILQPSFSVDGNYVFATVTSGQPGSSSVVRIAREDGSVLKVADQASDASCSPDGRSLVYVRHQTSAGYAEIWRSNLDGSNAKPIKGARFTDIGSPVVSPDGKLVAFSAPHAPTAQGLSGPSIPFLGPRTASAHGGNWEIFTIPIGGGKAELHTEIGENRPRVAWSPTGDSVAVNADLGIYVVDVKQNRTTLFDVESGSGLIWAQS